MYMYIYIYIYIGHHPVRSFHDVSGARRRQRVRAARFPSRPPGSRAEDPDNLSGARPDVAVHS